MWLLAEKSGKLAEVMRFLWDAPVLTDSYKKRPNF